MGSRSTKRYTIVIQEHTVETKLTKREYCRGVIPVADRKPGDEDGFGYTEQVPEKRHVSRTIYEQNVTSSNFDLTKVIKAINGIKE